MKKLLLLFIPIVFFMSCNNDQLKRENIYENGKYKTTITFYEDGKIMSKGRFNEGDLQDGLWEYYYENGNKQN